MKTIPNYHPPSDYRRPTKTQEKVYVPVNDYPEINFSMITNPLTPNHFALTLLLDSGSRSSHRCPLSDAFSARFLLTLALLLNVAHSSRNLQGKQTELTLSSCYFLQLAYL